MVMPPRVSPTQVIVIPIPDAKLSPQARAALNDKARDLASELSAAGVRTDSDLRDNYRPGWKYNYWELKACHLVPQVPTKESVRAPQYPCLAKLVLSSLDINLLIFSSA